MNPGPDRPIDQSDPDAESDDAAANEPAESPPEGGHLDETVSDMKRRLAADPDSFKVE
jgi:hypothetical protein